MTGPFGEVISEMTRPDCVNPMLFVVATHG